MVNFVSKINSLVDLRRGGIQRITTSGIETEQGNFEFDTIVRPFHPNSTVIYQCDSTVIYQCDSTVIYQCFGGLLLVCVLYVQVFATGFDAMTGPLKAMNVVGVGGTKIVDVLQIATEIPTFPGIYF